MLAPLQANTLFSEVLDFLASTPAPEEIIAFHASESLQERIRYLLEQNRKGDLTEDEKAPLDNYIELDYFMTMLKIRAKKKPVES